MKTKWAAPTAILAGSLGLVACGLLPPAQGDGKRARLPRDNSLCLLCHMNFGGEELVVQHISEGVTCARCHGVSAEHRNDETSRTKPDVLFGRAEVARFCRKCHKKHKRPSRVAAFLAEWQGRTRPNGRLILPQAMCTDCHGTHVIMAVPLLPQDAPTEAPE